MQAKRRQAETGQTRLSLQEAAVKARCANDKAEVYEKGIVSFAIDRIPHEPLRPPELPSLARYQNSINKYLLCAQSNQGLA